MATKWLGALPVKCDLCSAKLGKVFYDGKTQFGPWGIMCHSCFTYKGCGLGTGRGQKYDSKTGEKVEAKPKKTKSTPSTAKRAQIDAIMQLLGF